MRILTNHADHISLDGTGQQSNQRNAMNSYSIGPNSSLGSRIYQPNSAINQLKKVLQSVHLNQRVVSTTILLNPSNSARNLTPVTIDGIEVDQDFNAPICKIEVSRVFKYQGAVTPELILQRGPHLAPTPVELAKKQSQIIEWIDQMKDSPLIQQLTNEAGTISYDFKRAYKAAWFILSAHMPVKELNWEDFKDWFSQLATVRSQSGAD